MLFSIKAHSQVDALKNTINGQPIISSGMNFSNSGIGIGAVATSHDCYMIDNKGNPHNFFSTPKVSIADIASKIRGDSFHILILLSDGSAVLVKPVLFNGSYAYGYRDFKKSDSSYVSKSFKKILGDDVYVLSTAGFYKTHDLGKSWQWDTSGTKGAYIYDFALDTAQNVYLATTKGLYSQNPSATSWTKVSKFKPASASSIYIDRSNRFFVYTGSYIVKSTDGGSTWSADSSGLGYYYISKITDDAYGNLYTIASSGSDYHIYKSDGGTGAWKRIDGGLLALTGNNVIIHSLSGDSVLLAGTSFGLYTSNDQGKTWKEKTGIIVESASSLAKTPDGSIFVTTNTGLYKLSLTDTSWTKVYPVKGYKPGVTVSADKKGNLYAFDYTINTKFSAIPMLKSTDGGANWNVDTLGLGKITGSVFFMDETGAQHIASSYYSSSSFTQIWTRLPGGSWKKDNGGLPSKNYSYFTGMGSDKQGNLYADGYIGTGNVMYRKALSGTTWQIDTAGLSSASFRYMTSGGNSGILAWNYSTIYHRSGNGWHKIPFPSSISYPDVTAVSADSNGVIFAAFTDLFSNAAGVYYTRDTGLNWTYAGLAGTDVSSMQSYGDTTYVLSSSKWIYRILARPFTAVREPISGEVMGATVYPNPFHSLLTIRYDLPKPSQVKIELFSLIGERVLCLSDRFETAGSHQLGFNAEMLPNGIYIYRISASDKAVTGKLIKN